MLFRGLCRQRHRSSRNAERDSSRLRKSGWRPAFESPGSLLTTHKVHRRSISYSLGIIELFVAIWFEDRFGLFSERYFSQWESLCFGACYYQLSNRDKSAGSHVIEHLQRRARARFVINSAIEIPRSPRHQSFHFPQLGSWWFASLRRCHRRHSSSQLRRQH
jgi:hypothetical protein